MWSGARSGFNVSCAAGLLVLLSACAAEQPAAPRADSVLTAEVTPAQAARDPDSVRDAREATEEAVQRISGLASAAVSVVRELGQDAARSVIGDRAEDEQVVEGEARVGTDSAEADPAQ